MKDRKFPDLAQDERQSLEVCLEMMLAWGRVASRHSPKGARVRELFVIASQHHSWCLNHQVAEVVQSTADPATKVSTCVDLLQRGVKILEDGLVYASDDDTIMRENLDVLKQNLAYFQSQQRSLSGHRVPWFDTLEDDI
jgi:hypothetical protein